VRDASHNVRRVIVKIIAIDDDVAEQKKNDEIYCSESKTIEANF
jgi:hypothetical protein